MNFAHARSPRSRAFSMVELVTVLVVVGVLSAVALPRYTNSLSHYKADAAARQLIADLARAASAARASSTSVSVVFQPARNAYRVQGVTITLKGGGGDQRELDKEISGGTLAGADFAGDAILIFDGFGRGDSDGTAILRFGDNIRVITFSALSGLASFTRGGVRTTAGTGGPVDELVDGVGNVVGKVTGGTVTINVDTGSLSVGVGK